MSFDIKDVDDLAILIDFAISDHTDLKNRQIKAFDYYNGEHKIKYREIEGATDEAGNELKPNEKIIINYPELIVETQTNFLFSKKQSYSSKVAETDKRYKKVLEFLDHVNNIYAENNEETQTYSLGRTSGVAGFGVEEHWIKDKKHRFHQIEPMQWVKVTLNGGKDEIVFRYYNDFTFIKEDKRLQKQTFTKVDVYLPNKYLYFEENLDAKGKDEARFTFTGSQPHKWGEIPVIFYNNKGLIGHEGKSDIDEGLISMVDSYELAVSSSLNTILMNSDPYLKIKDLQIDPEQYQKLRDARTLFLRDGADAEYLTFDGQDTMRENFLDRIERLIFVISKTPDLFTKEGTQSGDSGLAIKMKFSGLEIKSDGKEKEFKKGLFKRLRLIAKQLENYGYGNFYSEGIYKLVDISFNRSIPQNTKELVAMAKELLGMVSEETRLQLLPFVEDVEKEMERMNAQKKQEIDPFTDQG